MTLAWAVRRAIRIVFIQPGQPQQNADVERYNRTARYDWLAHHLFETLDEIQDFASRWWWAYDHDRPNMALGGITPKQKLVFAAQPLLFARSKNGGYWLFTPRKSDEICLLVALKPWAGDRLQPLPCQLERHSDRPLREMPGLVVACPSVKAQTG